MRTAEILTAGQAACRRYLWTSAPPRHKTRPTDRVHGSSSKVQQRHRPPAPTCDRHKPMTCINDLDRPLCNEMASRGSASGAKARHGPHRTGPGGPHTGHTREQSGVNNGYSATTTTLNMQDQWPSCWAVRHRSPIFQAGHEGSIPFARSTLKPQVRPCAVHPRA